MNARKINVVWSRTETRPVGVLHLHDLLRAGVV